MRGIKITPADRRLSIAVRERDGWTCQRCWKRYVPPTSALHAAHMFSRACKRCTTGGWREPHGCTRLDPENLMALCYGCHEYADSHPEVKESLFRAKLGDERFRALRLRARGKVPA